MLIGRYTPVGDFDVGIERLEDRRNSSRFPTTDQRRKGLLERRCRFVQERKGEQALSWFVVFRVRRGLYRD